LLLIGGRTAHSTFKIPLKLWDGQDCKIPKQGLLAELLRKVDLIIWDELPMQDKLCAEAVDRSMRDIRNDQRPFGGCPVVFGGDFQQILPVVVKGSRQQIVGQCIQRSQLWEHVHVLKLKLNMRLNQDEAHFAEWLLDVGHGRNSDASGMVKLPDSMRCGNSLENLIQAIYGDLNEINLQQPNDQFFAERTILCGRNEAVDALNVKILNKLAGEEKVFVSSDSREREGGADGDMEYPVEFLNSINLSGMPLSKLRLKLGVPIMILRNLDQKNGLCNGTRAILTHIGRRLLQVRILGGDHAGKSAFIPRIAIRSDEDLPFVLRRVQFPIRLSFSMTINKSQGQSVRYVGLQLQDPVFTHGQLYVALSRCTSQHRIKALLSDDRMHDFKTPNIVID
jgi:PIF1-like helicase